MVKARLPIGVSDFQKMIREGYYYVDKSLFIKELIDSGSESILIPRPRRFGKTLNLSMLRYFYEKTENATRELFTHLAIWQQGESYRTKQGRHPVIFLTFKDVKSGNWTQCAQALYAAIGEEYRRHQYLLDTALLDEDEKDGYRAVIRQTADEHTYRNSLKKLSRWLAVYYGEKTVILIDEYDTPIQEGYLHGYYEPVVHFMRALLGGALKDNADLEKGVLTGILRIAKESIFSGLNNLEVCSLLVPEYSRWFGLLEAEVQTLLADCEVGTAPEEVKDWYNGYLFGDTLIYNPWSIINFAAKWRNGLQPYWVNTSSNDLIRQQLTESGGETKKELEALVRGETIVKELDDNLVFRDIGRSSEKLWSFLLFSGYLKLVSQKRDMRLYGELAIPNREVASLYEDIIREWFRVTIHSEQYRDMLEALTEGNLPVFEAIFRDFVMHAFSIFDMGGAEPEKVYHAFVLGLLVGLRDDYEVKSNRESGYGRYDVMLIPRLGQASGHKSMGVILEFKKAQRGETLEQAAEAALRQMEDRRYEAELNDRGIRHVFKLGIAFEGKQVCLKAGTNG